MNNPLRILYVIDTLEIGGSERSLLEITRRLDRRRYEPVVCFIYKGNTLQPAFKVAGIRVVELGIDGKYCFAQAIRRLVRLIRLEQPALIHTTLFRADQIGRAAGRWTGVPVVSSFVNLSYEPIRLFDNPQLSRWKLEMMRHLDALTARWVARFHAVSGEVAKANSRALAVPRDRIEVIPRGRPIAEQPVISEESRTELRRQLGVEEAYPLIVNVGRLVDQKGHKYLIESMVQVKKRYPRGQLLIAGEGNLQATLAEHISRLHLARHVHLLGSWNDIASLLQMGDLFVLPSLYEGMPGALIEAMLAGKPIIASDLPVICELVDDSETALLVPVGDSQQLAKAINALTADRDLGRRLGRGARTVARDGFDIDKVVRSMEDFYARVIRSSASEVSTHVAAFEAERLHSCESHQD